MNNYPLIKFVILFITGIFFQSFIQLSIITLFFLLICSLLIFIICSLIKLEIIKNIKTIIIAAAIILSGSAYLSMFSQKVYKYPFEEEKYSSTKIFGNIEKIDLKRDGRINLNLSSDSVITKKKTYKGRYKILCSIYDDKKKIDKLFDQLKIGNKISFIGVLQKPRDERNPGEFDYEKYLISKEIIALANIYNTDSIQITAGSISTYKNLIYEIRKKIDQQISSLHNKTTSALLRGLLLADRSMIDYQINDYFINAGVVHVLSVSGLHVSYIVLIFLVMFNRFNIYTRYFLTFIGLLFYSIITGADPPVLRSAIMALALMAAPATGRGYNSMNALSLSAFIVLLINPQELFNPSFQLSFSAILSLILIYPPLKHFVDNLHIKPKVVNWFVVFCITSFAAQLGTLPFTLSYFHRFSISSFIANIIVIPVSGAIVALGILTVVISTLSIWLGSVFGSANELLTYFMYYCVQLLGNKSLSNIAINQFSFFDAIVFYLILANIFFILKKFINPLAKVIAVSFSILLMILIMRLDNYELLPKDVLSVMAVDIGQGDGILIKFPNGKTALIDAGDATKYFDNGERIVLPLLNKLGIEKIDYGFISHVDSDHYRGFISLIENNRISFIYKPKLDTTLNKDIELEKYLHEKKVPYKYFSKEIIPVGNSRIYVLNDTTKSYFAQQSSNDKSGMLKLVYGKCSFLFTGDAGNNIEKEYVRQYGSFMKSNLLKAGHHGSKNSSSNEFLKAVQPNYTLISAGIGNKFHHPNKIVIDKLNEMKINIFRTDKEGAILLQSDGSTINKINWRNKETAFNF